LLQKALVEEDQGINTEELMKIDWMQQQQLSQLNEIREEMVSKEQSRRTDNVADKTDIAKEL